MLAVAAKSKMGVLETLKSESQDDSKTFNSGGDSVSLPKHSYWFDFWAFVVFDVIFFLFIYFVVP
uniref:Uncharacterized protein n=1 Tax=Mola mola TaxID=94237 RepID=A0A3Q3WEG3_MOLML